MTTILGLSGSLRRASFNAGLLRAAAEVAAEGCRIEIGSIKDVPLYDGDLEAAQGLPQAVQTLLLGGWLMLRSPAALRAIVVAWRVSLVAGSTGALASIGWFTAFALTSAANVRTLGMVEVVFSYLVSHRFLREKLAPAEQAGLVLVLIGVAALLLF